MVENYQFKEAESDFYARSTIFCETTSSIVCAD